MWSMGRWVGLWLLLLMIPDSDKVVNAGIQPGSQHVILVLLSIIEHTRKESDTVSAFMWGVRTCENMTLKTPVSYIIWYLSHEFIGEISLMI